MSKSKIEWTDAVWNPVTGCTKISVGCANCYAEREWPRLAANPKTSYYGRNFNDVRCHPERLDQPLRWKKPRKIFVNSMSDLFHEDVDDKFIAKVFAIMDLARHHTFMILTKRPKRARYLLNNEDFQCHVGWFESQAVREFKLSEPDIGPWPMKNVWLGVSVENQAAADERIPLLLQTPAAVRFISAEPLLGPIRINEEFLDGHYFPVTPDGATGEYWGPKIDWLIVGGESGTNARPMHPDWVRNLRDQCQEAGTNFFFKQWGEWSPKTFRHEALDKKPYVFDDGQLCMRVGKKKAGRELDGRTWEEMP